MVPAWSPQDSQPGDFGSAQHPLSSAIRLCRQAGVNWEEAVLLSQHQTETVSLQSGDECWGLNS